jgi:protein phosphatase
VQTVESVKRLFGITSKIHNGRIFRERTPFNHIITRAVGIDEIIESDVNTINDIFDKYSYILLCSDGLTSMISHDDIYRILTEEKGTQRKIDCLLAGANDSGGYDNITAVLLAVTE